MTALESEEYELVGDPDIRIPARSVLASLKPKGLGTPYIESLSSYYLELAHLHNMSPKTLARELIIPKIQATGTPRTGKTSNIWRMPLFNGIGAAPEIWARILSELTGQKDLVNLTLVPLRPYTNMQLLMSAKKKWCPMCYSEAAHEGRVYGQLLWEIAAVEACPKHGIKLLSNCRCNGTSPLPPINVKHLSGFCDSCGRSLSENYGGLIESASEEELKRAQLVADLLDCIETLKYTTDGNGVGIARFLQGAIKHFAGENAALFGKMIGVKKNTLHGWFHGSFIPTFPQMVEIALVCGCSIADIMLGTQTTYENAGLYRFHARPQRCPRRKAKKLDRETVKRQLKILADENPPVSVAQAAARIGVNRRTLFKNFGDIAKNMTRRFQTYRHSETMRKFEKKCDLYRQSAEGLMRQGIRPTRRLVGLDIKGKGTVGKEAYDRFACSRICREVMEDFNREKL